MILTMVMPTYNEEAIIEDVLHGWIDEFNSLPNIKWNIIVVDDGSKDNTKTILENVKKTVDNDDNLHGKLIIIHQKNKGHGVACWYGYREAILLKSDWVFQTDSDGQTNPKEFDLLWNARDGHDAIWGWRKYREDGSFRRFATKILQKIVSVYAGKTILDSNVPFRLIKGDLLESALKQIPCDADFTNILLSLVVTMKGHDIEWKIISFKPRSTGKNTVNVFNMAGKGLKAIREMSYVRKLVKTGYYANR